jgi:AraC-like DNA-binding protein
MHMVKDFADKLNISPKYFSSVCRKITGRSTGSLINEAVTSEAKQMLRNPQMTVKQRSNKLGFANASHFGTFFRRQTGMSPQQFRKKL